MLSFKKGSVNQNNIIICGDHSLVELYDKNFNVRGHAIIDTADVDLVKTRRWKIWGTYVVASRPSHILMHRFLLNAPGGLEVDHINRRRFDNRRPNLRLSDRSGNAKNLSRRHDNTSGVIGVYLDKRRGKWYAQIHTDGKTFNLGTFLTKDEAISARIKAEGQYFKEYAPQVDTLEHLLAQQNKERHGQL